MNTDDLHPMLTCKKCNVRNELDSYAIDHTCQGKHVFFFKCPECGNFDATAVNNIPPAQWPEFMDTEMLPKFSAELKAATKG